MKPQPGKQTPILKSKVPNTNGNSFGGIVSVKGASKGISTKSSMVTIMQSSPNGKKANSLSRKTSLQMNNVCSNFSKSQTNLIGIKNSMKKNIKVKDLKKKQLKQ